MIGLDAYDGRGCAVVGGVQGRLHVTPTRVQVLDAGNHVRADYPRDGTRVRENIYHELTVLPPLEARMHALRLGRTR